MAPINIVADYVIQYLLADGNRYQLSPLKLQKLLYYIEAWSLGINDTSIYHEDALFEAWVHGPVNVFVHERFARKHAFESILLRDVDNHDIHFDEGDEDFIRYILENYAPYSGYELELMCINELPWIEARAGCKRFEECHNTIKEELMRKYYREKYEKLG